MTSVWDQEQHRSTFQRTTPLHTPSQTPARAERTKQTPTPTWRWASRPPAGPLGWQQAEPPSTQSDCASCGSSQSPPSLCRRCLWRRRRRTRQWWAADPARTSLSPWCPWICWSTRRRRALAVRSTPCPTESSRILCPTLKNSTFSLCQVLFVSIHSLWSKLLPPVFVEGTAEHCRGIALNCSRVKLCLHPSQAKSRPATVL